MALKNAWRLKRNHQGYGDKFFIDEVFVKINGKPNGIKVGKNYFTAKTLFKSGQVAFDDIRSIW